jgi:predicted metal-dependent peptidase
MKEEEKISKAKVKIVTKCSFYGHILLNMNFKFEEEISTIGVDNNGNCVYSRDFINSLTLEETIGVLLHEVMHIALLSFQRVGDRDKEVWNISTDIIINNLLLKECFNLPKGGIIPKDDKINVCGVIIDKISNRTSEEVYNLLIDKAIKIKGFDIHKYGDGNKKFNRKWEKVVSDALTISNMRGDLPKNIAKSIGEIHNPKINWRQRLRKTIKEEIPYNQSYSKFNKKSIPLRTYIPGQLKEKVDIVIAIDTS